MSARVTNAAISLRTTVSSLVSDGRSLHGGALPPGRRLHL